MGCVRCYLSKCVRVFKGLGVLILLIVTGVHVKGEDNNIRGSSKLPEVKGSGKQSEDHHIVCSVFTFF